MTGEDNLVDGWWTPKVLTSPTTTPRASNAKAQRELGWTLRYLSRQGFCAAYDHVGT